MEELKEFLEDLQQVLDRHDVELITSNGISLLGFFGEQYIEKDTIDSKYLKKLLKGMNVYEEEEDE